jgi:hydrogenase maturation protease
VGDARILVLAYGNPGRRDDALGLELAARVEAWELPGVTVESDYQLHVEHSALIAGYDVVVFADAAVDAEDAFYLRPLHGAADQNVFSHSLSPAAVVQIAESLFAARPRAFLLGLRAFAFEPFNDPMTDEAAEVLEAALVRLRPLLAGEEPFPAENGDPG